MLLGFPGANIKEFWLTILSKAKRPQTQCLSPKGEFWVCSEANFRMVQNSFQKAKGNPGNRPHKMEVKKHRSHLLKIFCPIKSDIDKDTPMKTPEPPDMILHVSFYHAGDATTKIKQSTPPVFKRLCEEPAGTHIASP